MSAVELNAVSKNYGDTTAVDALDLAIETGEFVTLLGPSGCGKTTTLRMVAGFVRPTSGVISIGGDDVTGMPPHRRQVGLVFQNYALFPHMPVRKNVEFGLRMRGVAAAERTTRVAEALDLVRLGDLGDRFPGQLSGGQQQRVALARALVIRPQVLLLDEPFGALDKQLRDHMRVELRNLQQSLGISTLFVTHDQDEALSMSDRICVMSDGKVRQIGGPTDIYERPRSRFVADFMGRSNLLNARVTGRRSGALTVDAEGLLLEISTAEALAGDQVTVMIRPEKVVLQPAGDDGAKSVVQGTITNVVYLGSILHCEVALACGPEILVMRQNIGGPDTGSLAAGDAVAVHIAADAAYLIPA